MKILVVDDEPAVRRPIVRMLQRMGHEVTEVQDGEVAHVWFDPATDFVITDWQMPEMDGLELARALRRDGWRVPILLVTGRGDLDDALIEEVRAAGIDDYLLKPFSFQALKEKINTLLLNSEKKAPQ